MPSSTTKRGQNICSNRMETISRHGISYESTIDRNLDIITSATQAYAASFQGYRGQTVVNVANTKLHRIFRVELRGDTLIVTPRGDMIGFGSMEFQTELNHVLSILDDPEIPNLLVDLGYANYFGSQMIGAINSMIVKVRDAGGQTGVSDVSEDMLEGLSVMNLHEFWTIYATRNDAIRLIVTEPVSHKIGRKWRWIVASAVVILSSVGIAHFNFDIFGLDDTNIRFYRTITAVYAEYKELEIKDTNRNEWKIFSAKAKDELSPILKELQKRKHWGDTRKMYLLYALREGLMLIVLDDPSRVPPQYEAVYLKWIAKARDLINPPEESEKTEAKPNDEKKPKETLPQIPAKKSKKKSDKKASAFSLS